MGEAHSCEIHRGEKVVGRCSACRKGICRLCREAYGYFCSEACKQVVGTEDAPADDWAAWWGQHRRPDCAEQAKIARFGAHIDRWMRITKRWILPAGAVLIVLVIVYKATSRAGEVIWEFRPPEDKALSAITAEGSLVYVGCADGTLYALDKRKGTVRWTFKCGEGLHKAKPIVLPSRYGTNLGVEPDLRAGLCIVWDDSEMYALDGKKGKLVWRKPLPSALSESGLSTIPLDKRRLSGTPLPSPGRKRPGEVQSGAGRKRPGKVQSGAGGAGRKRPGEVDGQPVVGKQVICFKCDFYRDLTPEEEAERKRQRSAGRYGYGFGLVLPTRIKTGSAICALSIKDGRELWRKEIEEGGEAMGTWFSEAGGLALEGKTVYYSRREFEDGKVRHVFIAMDHRTGKGKWKAQFAGGSSTTIQPTEKGVLVASEENLYFVSPKGKKLWRGKKDPAHWPPTVSGRSIYCVRGKSLVRLDLTTGKKKWDAEVSEVTSRPVPGGGLVFVSAFTKKPVEKGKSPPPGFPTYRAPGLEDLAKHFARPEGPDFKLVPQLRAMDARSGKTLWTGEKIGGRLYYSHGHLLAVDAGTAYNLMDNTFYSTTTIRALVPRSGKKLWRFVYKGGVSSFCADESLLYICANSTSMHAGSFSSVRRRRARNHVVFAISIGR